MRIGLVVFVIFLSIICLNAQTMRPIISELDQFVKNHSAEKIYVHTDREIYSEVDTIWFKVYLIDAFNHNPITNNSNAYVELINEDNNIVIRNLILITDGYGVGDFDLKSKQIKSGNYVLRAYTNYQRNFGDDFLFKQSIVIKGFDDVYYGHATCVKSNNTCIKNNINIEFLPEGGYLSTGLPSILAFKTTKNGYPVSLNGWIVDSNKKKVVSFKTCHEGMGKAIFIPNKDEEYKAVVEGDTNYNFEIQKPINEIRASIYSLNDSIYTLRLMASDLDVLERKLNLICSSNGRIIFHIPINFKKQFLQFNIPKKQFSFGINQLTLTNQDFKPFWERLIFVKNGELLNIEISSNKQNYTTRENVELFVNSSNNNIPSNSNLSASIVYQKITKSTLNYSQNICTYLLLESELKGNINNPWYYFKDNSKTTNDNLDLLMLVHGWRNYKWNNFIDTLPSTQFKKESGIEVNGIVRGLFKNSGLKAGKVKLLLKNDNGFTYSNVAQTKDNGTFVFENVFFFDTASYFMEALNKNMRKNTRIENISSFSEPCEIIIPEFNGLNNQNIENSYSYELDVKRYLQDKVIHPEKYNITLEEIEVNETVLNGENNSDGYMRIYGEADKVIEVDDRAESYPSILHYISGMVSGLYISTSSSGETAIYIRGIGSNKDCTPLLLLNGTSVGLNTITSMPVSMIEKVEVLKSGGTTSIFGVKGGNGVIAFYSKRHISSDADLYSKGIINGKLMGYYKAKEFYSPNHEVDLISKNDHRNTIAWYPNLQTGNDGTIRMSFYTSDDTGIYTIKVQGLTADGKFGVGYFNIKVE